MSSTLRSSQLSGWHNGKAYNDSHRSSTDNRFQGRHNSVVSLMTARHNQRSAKEPVITKADVINGHDCSPGHGVGSSTRTTSPQLASSSLTRRQYESSGRSRRTFRSPTRKTGTPKVTSRFCRLLPLVHRWTPKTPAPIVVGTQSAKYDDETWTQTNSKDETLTNRGYSILPRFRNNITIYTV